MGVNKEGINSFCLGSRSDGQIQALLPGAVRTRAFRWTRVIVLDLCRMATSPNCKIIYECQ